MINVIEFNKQINTILGSSPELQALVNNKIYSLVLPENTVLPAIIFRRKFNNNFSKDGYSGSDVNVEVTVISEKYGESIEISMLVDELFSQNNLLLQSGFENYIDGIYVQDLEFSLKLI